MCTIIGGRINPIPYKDNIILTDDEMTNSNKWNFELSVENINIIQQMLNTKGGDYYGFKIFAKINNKGDWLPNYKVLFEGSSIEEFTVGINSLNNINTFYNNPLYFLFFSRLTPEMENNEVKITQPYTTINNKFIIAHGTIPIKDDTLVDIDTELFRYDLDIETSLKKAEILNGKVALIDFDPINVELKGIHNGLGLWKFKNKELSLITNINIFDQTSSFSINYNYDILNNYIEPYYLIHLNNYVEKIPSDKKYIFSLCSGGMDTIMSTTEHIKQCLDRGEYIPKIFLAYFDWGTRANIEEFIAVEDYKRFLNNYIKYNAKTGNILPIVETIKFSAKNYFKEVFNLAGVVEESRLCDTKAIGLGKEEAEEALSYVPLRNTHLILNSVSWLETNLPGEDVDIIIGANLTEGMVYGDNSSNYVEKINSLIKLAGQKTYNYNVIAPFKNVTKTKMLESIRENFDKEDFETLIDISFSCYFPVDGRACGSCGSCLLKETSVAKAKNLFQSKPKFSTPTPYTEIKFKETNESN